MVGAIAMSEPGAGSDLKGIRTTAVAGADGYQVNGSKTFISNGYLADLILVVVKTDPAAGAQGRVAAAARDEGQPGLPRRPHPRESRAEGPGHLRAVLRRRPRAARERAGRRRRAGLRAADDRAAVRAHHPRRGRRGRDRARAAADGRTHARAQGLRPGADRDAEHPLRAGRDQDRGDHRAHLHRPLHRRHDRRPHGHRAGVDGQVLDLRPAVQGRSTSACSCSAATATCSNTRSRRCTWTRACSASTAAPTRS